jgi:hypothetical protein
MLKVVFCVTERFVQPVLLLARINTAMLNKQVWMAKVGVVPCIQQ